MSKETLPAYAALKEACEDAGLHPVGTTCDDGVICEDALKVAQAAGFGRVVPLQAGLTIVYRERS